MQYSTNAVITVMVRDMDVAIDFYTNTLGMKLEGERSKDWSQVNGPGLTLGLHPADEMTNFATSNLSIGLCVPNLDEAIAELQGKGVAVTEKKDSYMRLAYFTDPDDTQLYLVAVDMK